MRNIIVVTGGAGFIGSNLILKLISQTTYKIISYDNYSTGSKKNHIKNSRLKYLKGHTKDISKKLFKYKKKINTIFHFGEFSRIYQSFSFFDKCIDSNSIGSHEVFSFCLKNKIKLIYSATSASLGNKGNDRNLSPYAFTKAKNLELLNNLKQWFGLNLEVIYFYNVYGPNQISKGKMATVIGIFEECYKNKKRLPVVRPGNQTRRFTHVKDTVEVCFEAWIKNKSNYYSISSRNSYSILQIAKMFKSDIKFLPKRSGERYASALTKMSFTNKVNSRFGKINIKDYINNIVKKR